MAEFEFCVFDEDYDRGDVEDVKDEIADDKKIGKTFLEEIKKNSNSDKTANGKCETSDRRRARRCKKKISKRESRQLFPV